MKIRVFVLLLLVWFPFLNTAEKISVTALDPKGLTKILDDYKGKNLLINIWATWCKPCKKEFPDIVTLRKKYPPDKLSVISISVDYPDEIDSKIRPFLVPFSPTGFPVFVQNFRSSQSFIDQIHPDWSGALPATLIIDRKGKKTLIVGKRELKVFQDHINKLR